MAYNKNNERSNEPIEFQIVKHIGDLTIYQTGWVKEVNIVSWNNAAPKIDIREWSPDHERMSKGITLFEDEAKKLAKSLNEHFGVSRTEKTEKSVNNAKEEIPIEGDDKGNEAA